MLLKKIIVSNKFVMFSKQMFENITINREISKIIAPEFAFGNSVLPLDISEKVLEVGVIDLNNIKLLNDLKFDTGMEINPIEMPADIIHIKLRELYPEYVNEKERKRSEIFISDSTTVDFVNQVISGALKREASDIHFEALEDSFRIRYRIDGHLREVSKLSKERAAAISSRIKIMANLDIAEKRRPQDGKISFKYEGRDIDIRVSTLPTSFGEKTVLRLLDKSNLLLDLDSLGMDERHIKILRKHIHAPYGMILVTGPTGSGKTTTLYAALNEIHTEDKNIMTIEDPVEYNINGINQCHVKSDIGFDFASALRSFLRQDPDIIMVGEIRDRETAEIAIRASLTGHLVFSTLHTNDAISAISRLIDMGVEPFLVASSVRLIVAQRLVRKLCSCKKAKADKQNGEQKFITTGCEICGYSGYKGRTALIEMAEITEDISELISRRATYNEILQKVKENNFISLLEAGKQKIKNGITTYEEVLRETSV